MLATRRGRATGGPVPWTPGQDWTPASESPVWGVVFATRVHEASNEEEVARGRLLVLVEYLRSIQRDGSR